jgi:hypothetical protein
VAAESGPSNTAASPEQTAPPATPPGAGAIAKPRAGSGRAAPQPTVAQAQVCQRLSTTGSPDWRCEEVGSSVAPGTLVYYTRIKSASATTVEHRWYHGDDLQQSVRLRVTANSDPGYRTYSRLTIGAVGRWRVEVRTAGGAVLHEERFTVR